MLKKIILLTATLSLALPLVVRAATLTLTPADGTLYGTPSSTVGWGFTISSDDYYLLLFDVSFNSTAGWGDFTGFTGDLGSFVVEPGTPVTHTFDGLQSGVGSFAIHADASPGFVTSGIISISYGEFSVDPNDILFNPETDIVSLDKVFSNAASVTVTDTMVQPNPSPVPEPSTLLLVGAGLALSVGIITCKKRKEV